MKFYDHEMISIHEKKPDEDSHLFCINEKFPALGAIEAYYLDGNFWPMNQFNWPIVATHWIDYSSTLGGDEWVNPNMVLPAVGKRVIARNPFCESESWIMGFNELGKPAWGHIHWEHADDFVTGWKEIKNFKHEPLHEK